MALGCRHNRRVRRSSVAPERQRGEVDNSAGLPRQLFRGDVPGASGRAVPAVDAGVRRSQLLGQRLGVRAVQRQRDSERHADRSDRQHVGDEYTLEDCSGCGVSGWGWQDNGYGLGVLGPLVYFVQSGTQTIRIQGREDGISIDQIVLSPSRYLTGAPGALRNDTTILPETAAPPPLKRPANVRLQTF